MPKISALPPMTTADAADEQPIVDTSVGNTKKWTLTLLKTYLISLTTWVIGNMIDFTTMPGGKSQRVLAASGNTTSTSYVNLPGGSNSFSFTKRRGTETKLILSGTMGFFWGASPGGIHLGVRVDSTDYDLATVNANQNGIGLQITGANEVTGLAAGVKTITLRAKTAAGGTLTQDNLFTSTLTVLEVPA